MNTTTGVSAAGSSSVRPFRIDIPDRELVDLRARLANSRWPGEITPPSDGANDWRYGTPETYLRELCEYWHDRFDWRAVEQQLNRWPQVVVDVGDLEVHAVHVRGRGPNPMPLVLTHGWPSSFFEFSKVIDALADPGAHGGDPADAFDVIVPSMPGYGFSSIPDRPGVHAGAIADAWAGMMTALGYDRFGVHGGDWGSLVSTLVARQHPQRTIGAHLTMLTMGLRGRGPQAGGQGDGGAEDAELAERRRRFREMETGYQAIQRTKPQSLAYGLTDSPSGLAGWIVEKFRKWGDTHGDLESRFSKDDLLANLSIYWFTRTINSSMRLYFEGREAEIWFEPDERIEVPCGFAAFPTEGVPPADVLRERYNVVHYTTMPSGGHFAALEEPSLLVEDLRAFFRLFRPGKVG